MIPMTRSRTRPFQRREAARPAKRDQPVSVPSSHQIKITEVTVPTKAPNRTARAPSTGEKVYDKGVYDLERLEAAGEGGYAQPDESMPHPHTKPIILDLTGDGIDITELSQSQMFVDANNDGLLNQIAWAGAGDGVLFYDADGDGQISETREFIFTEWDPTAASDLEAMASVFDTNGDGELSGAELAEFKVMVTNADGTMVAI